MKVVLAIVIVIGCIFFRDNLESLFNKIIKSVPVSNRDNTGIFTADELSNYDGVKRDKIFLSLMGSIFDVTSGIRHYGQGGPYNYFVGKDGSRSFITGDFRDESNNKDHVLDLSCDDLFTLTNWGETLREKYKPVGVLIGRYYDENGKETEYFKHFSAKQSQCEIERQAAKLEEQTMPPCNMEWNADTGTKVWCSKTRHIVKSPVRQSGPTIPSILQWHPKMHFYVVNLCGGVKRSWVGVPRQLYSPGKEHPRCVCVNLNDPAAVGLLKEYEDCPVTSTQCTFKST